MFSIDVDPFKLYKLRKKANLLQSDVAALLGKSLLTYTKYEQGKTKIPKKDLEILSKEYQCELIDFYTPELKALIRGAQSEVLELMIKGFAENSREIRQWLKTLYEITEVSTDEEMDIDSRLDEMIP